ncbi:unnamed protein product [Rhodiola kirilowii]
MIWVVTEKLGNAMKQKSTSRPSKKPKSRITERIHVWEIVVGFFLLHCAVYDMLYGKNHFYAYLVLQAGHSRHGFRICGHNCPT